MNKIAFIMLNYNMPEVINHNLSYIWKHVEYPYEVFLVDNGSPNDDPIDHALTTVHAEVSYNYHSVHGHILGCQLADSYFEREYGQPPVAYCIMTTTGIFEEGEGDVITPCVEFLEDNPEACMIQPAYTEDSIGFWQHLKKRGDTPRRTWMIEYSICLYEGEWFREVGGFHPKIHIHGNDLWLPYLARLEDRSMWVHDGVQIRRHNNNMHEMNRSDEKTPEGRSKEALKSLVPFGQEMLGNDWWSTLLNSNVEDSWR